MAKKKTETIIRELRESLLENLEVRGLVEDVYTDMVNTYCDLWLVRRDLNEQVNRFGVIIVDGGKDVANPAIAAMNQTAKQMLAIYTSLGFRDAAVKTAFVNGEDDEL